VFFHRPFRAGQNQTGPDTPPHLLKPDNKTTYGKPWIKEFTAVTTRVNARGQMLPRFLKPEAVVANYAESGESLMSFRRENRLQKILRLMKPGDFPFIEFAHNDQKPGGNYADPCDTCPIPGYLFLHPF